MTRHTTPTGIPYDLTITPAGPLTDEMRRALWQAAMELVGPQERTQEQVAYLHSLTPDGYCDHMIAEEEIA